MGGNVCSCLGKEGEHLTQFLSNNIQKNEFGNSKSKNDLHNMQAGNSIFDQLELEEKYNMEYNENTKNIDFYPEEVVNLVNRIKLVKMQSIVKGYLFRKKFRTKLKEELVVKNFLENVFIQFNTEELEKKESNFPNFNPEKWKEFYEEDCPLYKVDYGKVFKNCLRKSMHNYYMGDMNINDEKHGIGRLINKAGVVYHGNWYHDVFQGWGRMIYPNGVLYEGKNTKVILQNIF
jgi:hypothetical protein